jgi:hypothetical protein
MSGSHASKIRAIKAASFGPEGNSGETARDPLAHNLTDRELGIVKTG